MREILKMMRQLDSSSNRLSKLMMLGSGNWGIYYGNELVVGSGNNNSDDPTADIIAALKAKLPPTLDDARNALADIARGFDLDDRRLNTIRRYLEAQSDK